MNNSSWTSELSTLLAAIQIVSPTCFILAGQAFQAPNLEMPSILWQGWDTNTNPLLLTLQQQLYHHGFCHQFQGFRWETPMMSQSEDTFINQLITANSGQDRWDLGWQIEQILPSGQVFARKGEFRRVVWPGEFMTQDSPGIPPRPGALIRLFAPKESCTLQPGFYFIFGETLLDEQDLKDYVRFYWHLQAMGAPRLIHYITQAFNRYQVPFRFKCLSHPALFDRRDAAVLFVSRRFYRIAAELLTDFYPYIQPDLHADTPLFTLPLAPGLGLAEDPGTGESFGMHRCRLVAKGLWNAYLQGFQTEIVKLQEITQQFMQIGLNLNQPHLNPGSSNQYSPLVTPTQ